MTLQALNFRPPRILLAVSTQSQSDADPRPACQWQGPTQGVAGVHWSIILYLYLSAAVLLAGTLQTCAPSLPQIPNPKNHHITLRLSISSLPFLPTTPPTFFFFFWIFDRHRHDQPSSRSNTENAGAADGFILALRGSRRG
ncbi:hypothetical protein B0H13DRAFT_2049467, partial [Mycena leptocephala]